MEGEAARFFHPSSFILPSHSTALVRLALLPGWWIVSVITMNAGWTPSLRSQPGRAPLLLLLCFPFVCRAADWPQYRGPNHDGVSTERINKQWTGWVSNALWRVFLGNGLTSLTVSGGRVLTQ